MSISVVQLHNRSLPKELARSAAVELDFLRAMLLLLLQIAATSWSFVSSEFTSCCEYETLVLYEMQFRLTGLVNNSGKKIKGRAKEKESD